MTQAAANGLDPSAACRRLALQQQPLLGHLRPLTASHSLTQMPFLPDAAYCGFPQTDVHGVWVPPVAALYPAPSPQPPDEQPCLDALIEQAAAGEDVIAEGTTGHEDEAGLGEGPAADADSPYDGPIKADGHGPSVSSQPGMAAGISNDSGELSIDTAAVAAVDETGASCLPSDTRESNIPPAGAYMSHPDFEKSLTPSSGSPAKGCSAPQVSMDNSSAGIEDKAATQPEQQGFIPLDQPSEAAGVMDQQTEEEADEAAAPPGEKCSESGGAVFASPDPLHNGERADLIVEGVARSPVLHGQGRVPEQMVQEELSKAAKPAADSAHAKNRRRSRRKQGNVVAMLSDIFWKLPTREKPTVVVLLASDAAEHAYSARADMSSLAAGRIVRYRAKPEPSQ